MKRLDDDYIGPKGDLAKSVLIDYYGLKGIDYIFEIDPVAKPRMTQKDKWAGRPCVLKYWAFKEEMLIKASQAGFDLPDQFLVTFNMPFFESYTLEQKERLRGRPHRMKPDLDNMMKSVLDIFNVRDQSVWSYWPRKFWADKGSIVITI